MLSNPRSAMILAAGLATRMRPLTDEIAKPLLTLGGRTLVDHTLDHLRDAGVLRVVVNAFWQADRLLSHLANHVPPPELIGLREAELLDTGGGVRNALPLLGPDPFYVINGDAFWLNGPTTALKRVAKALDPNVDVVLLVHRTCQVHAETGTGDFAVNQLGVPRRPAEHEVVPYIFAGVSLMRSLILHGMPAGAFSLNQAWDRAMETGRIRAVVHDGIWFHLSTPGDLAQAEQVLEARVTGDVRWPWR
jgi:N-acetyl-alpha-D-muramate 1-phosphate uridylyltransferase